MSKLVFYTNESVNIVVAEMWYYVLKGELLLHHLLKSMPEDLRGLCRMRVGDYRVIYWIYNEEPLAKVGIL